MINIGFISLDIIIIFIVILFLIIHGIKTGKRLILTLIISTYPALLIFKNFPFIDFESGMVEAVGFLFIYLILIYFLYKTISNKKVYTTFRKITDYTLLSISYLALIISISSNSIMSLQNLYAFSGFFPNLINQIEYGIVLIIPLVVILLTTKSDKI